MAIKDATCLMLSCLYSQAYESSYISEAEKVYNDYENLVCLKHASLPPLEPPFSYHLLSSISEITDRLYPELYIHRADLIFTVKHLTWQH